MTYGREKRQMLAWLALLAPLPLPFSQTLEWPALFVYSLVLVYFLQRVERDDPIVFSNRILNLLGLLYLPILFFDLRFAVARSRPVAALLHLIMFLIVVKLYSMKREKDKWHLVVASFFLFLGGMATSTHLSVGFYLLGFMIFTLIILARFALLHMLATQNRPRQEAGAEASTSEASHGELSRPGALRVPYRRPLLAGSLLVVLIAIPTFATMPRFREPFFFGPGGSSGSLIRTTGFSDSVDLSLTSSIRGNRDVVMRVQFQDNKRNERDEMRFKGATYDRYENRRWHRLLQHSQVLTPQFDEDHGRLFRIENDKPATQAATRVEIFRERMNSQSLILPMETLAVSIQRPQVNLDLGGAAFLVATPLDTIRYQAFLGEVPKIKAMLARDGKADSPQSALDQAGISDAMRRLAAEVMGDEAAPEERVDRLERHLLSEYSYTLDFVGRDGQNPLDDFLFTYKSGHCEYFASSMVLLLRAGNIPARLATGFLGAEYNPLEGYYMVRQEYAHAWVEAYTPERGWRVYDPTPPEGRPAQAERGFIQLLNQLYDYMTFRWDRYILTYGVEDQRSFFQEVRKRLSELWRDVTGWNKSEGPSAKDNSGLEMTGGETTRQQDLWLSKLPLPVAVALFFSAVLALVLWHRRRPLNGEIAYRRLRQRLGRAGLAISDTLAPLELRDLALARYPSAMAPTRRLVDLYIRESFAEQPLAAEELAFLKQDLRAVREAMKREDRQRRQTRKANR